MPGVGSKVMFCSDSCKMLNLFLRGTSIFLITLEEAIFLGVWNGCECFGGRGVNVAFS